MYIFNHMGLSDICSVRGTIYNIYMWYLNTSLNLSWSMMRDIYGSLQYICIYVTTWDLVISAACVVRYVLYKRGTFFFFFYRSSSALHRRSST